MWTRDLDRSMAFYCDYFAAEPGERYARAGGGFESCFLTFASGSRLELMATSTLDPTVLAPGEERMGLTHLAISVGGSEAVDKLAATLAGDGYLLLDGPRLTGDGYYEAVVLDPDGNRLEITG